MGKTNKLYGVTKKLQAKKPSKRRKKTVKRRLSPWIVATALSAVLLAVLLPYIRSGRFAETGAPVPKGYHSYCIDLSHHNGTAIAWDSLRVVIDARGRTSKDLLGAREILPVSRIYLKPPPSRRPLPCPGHRDPAPGLHEGHAEPARPDLAESR